MKSVPVAVVGLACWYPGASTLRELWENILARRVQFRRMPDVRLPLAQYHDRDREAPDKTYGTEAALIDGFTFDWEKHRVPRSTFETADIAHWLALQVALESLADAGYARETVSTSRTGVILGNTLTGEQTRTNAMRQRWPFVRRALRAAARGRVSGDVLADLEDVMEERFKSVLPAMTEDSLSGGLSNTIAGRICNYLNLDGGGYTVDGACSSSLLAVATAASGLAAGDLDMALAGGVDISLDTFELVGFAKTGALTPDDMRVYDREANGFIPGEGCGFAVLKRLEDARAAGDYVYAVLQGWGVSSDGRGGLTAPSREGQAKALRRAYDRAGYSAGDVTFFEGHGTGTPVGDREELAGIALAIGPTAPSPIRRHGMTSFKSLVGHTKAAAGIGGFIKAVMAVNQRVVPPTAGCREPSAVFASDALSLYPVQTGRIEAEDATLRAGVSAMGFGGINCHVTLESADAPAAHVRSSIDTRLLLASRQDSELFVLSAASREGLAERVRAVSADARGIARAEITDLAARLAAEAPPDQARAAIVAGTPQELEEQLERLSQWLAESGDAPRATPDGALRLETGTPRKRVGFLFPGQGSQQLDMARVLVERHPWARRVAERFDERLRAAGHAPVGPVIWRALDRAHDETQVQEWARALAATEIAQPAIALASVLWARHLNDLGIRPVAVGGHSLGELVACWAAGAFDLDTLIDVVAARGAAMAAPVDAAGTMASLVCDANVAARLVSGAAGGAVVANINSPQQTVVSGARAAVDAVLAAAESHGIRAQRLRVSNAFHSPLVAGAADQLRRAAEVPPSLGAISTELWSSVDGQPLRPGLDLREHLARQIVSPVDFVSLSRAIAARCDVLLEVGPGRVLSSLVNDTLGSARCWAVAPRPDGDKGLNTALAAVFTAGVPLRWSALFQGRLVRPFVPARARTFIVSPCERPFADGVEESVPVRETEATPSRVAASRRPAPSTPSAPGSAATIEQQLIARVAARTGFAADGISLSARLLDDLNLDSIKAGEIIAAVAKDAGAAGRIDSMRLLTASLQAVAEAIRAAAGGTSAVAGEGEARPAPWVRDFIADFVAEPIGPVEDEPWRGVLVGVTGEDRDLVAAVSKEVERRGARIVAAGDPACDTLIATMPSLAAAVENPVRLARALHAVVGLLNDKLRRVVFVQSGGGATAFASSLHLERPDLRVRVVDVREDVPVRVRAATIADELGTTPAFTFARYDERGARFARQMRRRDPAAYRDRGLSWSEADVVIVTGGAKGITAELAAAFGGNTGARLVLVGSSAQTDAEVARRLERLRQAGIAAVYRRCDLGDDTAVRALVASVRAELGPVTGVVHGAGLNRPRRVEQVSIDDALSEIGPKLRGALNLCAALEDAPPRMWVALSSIIGVTGMPGNAWYGFSNEMLPLLLERFRQRHPDTQVLSVAYSVWGEVGMGARMGSVDALSSLGIAAIPTAEGVSRFLRLMAADAGAPEVIVAGPLGGLDTWTTAAPVRPATGGFLEDIRRFEPGIEIAARAHLTFEKDPYVVDHVFKGSALFPTVFGLEAMAQLVAGLLERETLGPVCIEDIRLDRPIVVDPQHGTTIEIRARLLETALTEPLAVEAEIGVEQSGFERAHFAARFRLARDGQSAAGLFGGPAEPLELPESPLAIDPKADLYTWLYFQGPRFQRLLSIHHLDSAYGLLRIDGSATVADTSDSGTRAAGPWTLGDPYARDALLQAPQLTISQHLCLPVHIERIEIADPAAGTAESRAVRAVFDGREDDTVRSHVEAASGGHVIERLLGYRLQVMESRPDYPTPEEIAAPRARDERLLRERLAAAGTALGVASPDIAVARLTAVHADPRDERHRREQPLLQELVARLAGDVTPVEIAWEDGVKPVVRSPAGWSVSLAHQDDGCCLLVAGRGDQACDLVGLEPRLRPHWIGLLGAAYADLLAILERQGDSPTVAGARLWSAREALAKVGERADVLEIERRDGAAVLLRAGSAEAPRLVLTLPLRLTLGAERMVAVLVSRHAARAIEAPAALDLAAAYGFEAGAHGMEVTRSEDGGPLVFTLRFPVGFRESARASRGLYFTHLFGWMGRLREAACQPVQGPLVDDFASGRWGMVTNDAETAIYGDARSGDVVEGRVWVDRVGGPHASTLDLRYEWCRLGPGGASERIALSKMTVTWVAIVGHGTVEARPFPSYFQQWVDRVGPTDDWVAHDFAATPPVLPGGLLHREPAVPTVHRPLVERAFETALEDSNLVGNLYFADYAIWQGRTLDAFWREIGGGDAELRCVFSRTEHLREAMPFDTIVVRLQLLALYDGGVQLGIEYYRRAEDGGLMKLAFGAHHAVYCERDAAGRYVPRPLPARICEALLSRGHFFEKTNRGPRGASPSSLTT